MIIKGFSSVPSVTLWLNPTFYDFITGICFSGHMPAAAVLHKPEPLSRICPMHGAFTWKI